MRLWRLTSGPCVKRDIALTNIRAIEFVAHCRKNETGN